MSTRNLVAHYEGIDGGMLIYWMVQHKAVAKFIKDNKIPPVEKELLPLMNIREPAETKTAEKPLFIRPFPFPGGIMVPHLHYKNDLYMLNREQWQKFSKKSMRGFHEKIERAGTVGFSQFTQLSKAVNSL